MQFAAELLKVDLIFLPGNPAFQGRRHNLLIAYPVNQGTSPVYQPVINNNLRHIHPQYKV
jgi:hypothetical protein